jgi:hypothetical protein
MISVLLFPVKARPVLGSKTLTNSVATGDGVTDVTAALSFAFYATAALGYVLFIPTGSYIITSTIVVSFPCFFCSIVAP